MILAVITCIGVFEVADYESRITFWKFKIADPIWRPDRKKNSQNLMILAVITCIGVSEVADYESNIRLENLKWWIQYGGLIVGKIHKIHWF